MSSFCGHFYRYRHQYYAIRRAKENMQHGEVVIHVDFSENYTVKSGKEIQEAHFGHHNQIIIHQGVAYMKVT
jgi:DNA-directed RNA polymerase subunit K/omega